MKWLKVITGVIGAAIAALMIQYWPYNFESLIEPEYQLEWSEELQSEYLIQMAPGINIVSTLPTYEAHQRQMHHDIAAEIPLYWEWKSEFPVYLVNKCFKKKPTKHWHVARLYGPMMVPIPGVKAVPTSEMGKVVAEFDYQNAMQGMPSPLIVEPKQRRPEPLKEAPLREASL
jgi:hypothetical protein